MANAFQELVEKCNEMGYDDLRVSWLHQVWQGAEHKYHIALNHVIDGEKKRKGRANETAVQLAEQAVVDLVELDGDMPSEKFIEASKAMTAYGDSTDTLLEQAVAEQAKDEEAVLWTCLDCGEENRAFREKCNCCSRARDLKLQSGAEQAKDEEAVLWTCLDCGEENRAFREKCNCCSRARVSKKRQREEEADSGAVPAPLFASKKGEKHIGSRQRTMKQPDKPDKLPRKKQKRSRTLTYEDLRLSIVYATMSNFNHKQQTIRMVDFLREEVGDHFTEEDSYIILMDCVAECLGKRNPVFVDNLKHLHEWGARPCEKADDFERRIRKEQHELLAARRSAEK